MTQTPSVPMSKATLLQSLYSMQQSKRNVDLAITNSTRQGIIHIRNGEILSAQTGILNGNGALLTLAQLSEPEINVTEAHGQVQKTIAVTLQQVQRFLSSHPPVDSPLSQDEEEALLQEAIRLVYQFKYKSAVEKLVTLLKKNRFFYPAWLWQSRILTRQDYIEKALDEAYRWGNHDQDVWRESRKIRPQLDGSSSTVKRCMFCSSILSKDSFCAHCRAFLVVTGQPIASDLKKDDIESALVRFNEALSNDPANSRIAYALAVGYFNLKSYKEALDHMRQAARQAPQSNLYRKSLSLLLAVAKVHKPVQSTQPAKDKPLSSPSKQNTILVIEDSQTSRKVLSMLFKRHSLQIIEAATGKDALLKAKQYGPDLIILDVMLPDTNGHALLPELRNINKAMAKTPVIMLTGKTDSHERMHGMNAGANEYVTKPFDPNKLIALVNQYLPVSDNGAGKPHKKISTVTQAHTTRAEVSPPAESKPVSPSATPQKKDKGKKTIFVIEDSVTSRKVLSMVLGRNGFTIHEATTGQEALEIAKSIEPDLVLLDVMLPDMTGYTILPKLKELPHFRDLPVIMLTGKSGTADRMKGILAGTNEYLTKPFNPQKLLSVIGAYV